MANITIEEYRQKRRNNEDHLLIDVREPYEHSEFNIGGTNLPVGQIQNWITDLGDDKDKDIVLYCRTGSRSGMATAFMKAQGFSKAMNLEGGVEAWRATSQNG